MPGWARGAHRDPFRACGDAPAALGEHFSGPLRAGPRRRTLVVVGQIGQSLDGRTATMTGHSHYINGSDGPRPSPPAARPSSMPWSSGSGRQVADDPLLTVRRVRGPHPVRVIIDPNRRLPALRAGRCATTASSASSSTREGNSPGFRASNASPLPVENSGGFRPRAILASLGRRGGVAADSHRGRLPGRSHAFSKRIVSNRLHVVVAPIILGGGLSGLALTPIARLRGGGAAAAHPHPPDRQRGAVRPAISAINGCRSARRKKVEGDRSAIAEAPGRQMGRRVRRATHRGKPGPRRPSQPRHWPSRPASRAGSLHRRVRTPSSEGPFRNRKTLPSPMPPLQPRRPGGPSAGPKPLSVSWWRLTASIIAASSRAGRREIDAGRRSSGARIERGAG